MTVNDEVSVMPCVTASYRSEIIALLRRYWSCVVGLLQII